MERRKVLLGSGTVIAMTLAGCMAMGDSETDDDGDDDDDGSRDFWKDDSDDKDDKHDDIPGVEIGDDKYTVKGAEMTLDVIELDDSVLRVEGTIDADREEARKDYEAIRMDVLVEFHKYLSDAIKDPDAFKSAVVTISVTLTEESLDETHTVIIEVDWLIDYMNGDLSESELKKKLEEAYS